MNINKLCILVILSSIPPLVTCRDDDDVKVFKPDATLVDQNLCANVRCYSIGGGDTICYQGGVINYNTRLPDDHPCVQHLVEVKPSTPPDGSTPPADLPESQLISLIIPDSSKIYGFDDGRGYYQYDKSSPEKRIHYISVKEGGMALFQLYISKTVFQKFNSFKVRISNTSTIAFDSLYTLDTLVITDTITDIQIYGHWDNEYFPEEIIVYGINRRSDTLALVCDTCEQQLEVFCWEEMVFDSLRIYFVNSPSFNPDSVTIKNEINNILKQAVQRAAFVFKGIYNKTGWDNNGNGKLDLFPVKDSVPGERLEHIVLLDSIESTFSDCHTCDDPQIDRQTPKIIVTPSTINLNWLLMEDANAGSDTIIVQYFGDFRDPLIRDVEFVLSSWDGSNSETVSIHYVLSGSVTNEDENRMGLKIYAKNLLYDHPRHSVLRRDNFPRGVTYTTTSCTWMMGSTNYHDIVHELLHMRKVGPLSHDINDTINIMFPEYINPSYNLLRYRQIQTDDRMGNGTFEQQWAIIRRDKF